MGSRDDRDVVPLTDALAVASPEQVTLAATRDLLRITAPGDARDIAVGLALDLGGEVASADDADSAALPLDLSFGAGPPLLAVARPGTDTRRLLERFLPPFVEDGRRAVSLVQSFDRLADEAVVDPLTGLANRRATGRALGRLADTDAVVLLDLDDFKALNDTHGHEAGDQVLEAFGAMLRDTLRERDHAGRQGGEEFLLILGTTGPEEAEQVVRRLFTRWERDRPMPVTFSAGIACGQQPDATIAAADSALYRAKRRGRNRLEQAGPEDY